MQILRTIFVIGFFAFPSYAIDDEEFEIPLVEVVAADWEACASSMARSLLSRTAYRHLSLGSWMAWQSSMLGSYYHFAATDPVSNQVYTARMRVVWEERKSKCSFPMPPSRQKGHFILVRGRRIPSAFDLGYPEGDVVLRIYAEEKQRQGYPRLTVLQFVAPVE